MVSNKHAIGVEAPGRYGPEVTHGRHRHVRRERQAAGRLFFFSRVDDGRSLPKSLGSLKSGLWGIFLHQRW